MSEPNLTFVGGGQFLLGIPADTLSPLDIAVYAERRGQTSAQLRKELVASGLYVEAAPEPKPTKKPAEGKE